MSKEDIKGKYCEQRLRGVECQERERGLEEGQVGIAREDKVKEDYYEVYGSAKLQYFNT